MMDIERSTSSFVKLLPIFVLLQSTGVKTEGCKKINWLSKKSGSFLRNHTIQTLTTASESMCKVKCYLGDLCLSHNFHENTGTCDINDSDEFQHPDDLIQKSGYVYRGTQNGCQSKPCSNLNHTCQANFNVKGGFKCLCPNGFTDPGCNKDINECDTGAHTCSIYTRCDNTRGSFRCIPLIGTKKNPAKSCLYILKGGYSNGTGEYWLDPANTGTPIPALCDMTTDGGGWTIVTKLIQPSTTALVPAPFDTYEVIKEYHNMDKIYFPKGAAMLDIHQKMGFHQIHFYCRKVTVGRVVSIMTKNNTAGQDVVSFFTNPGAATVAPSACGSFDRLPEDRSMLAKNCQRWGGKADTGTPAETNEWGGACCMGAGRIVSRPFHIVSYPRYGFEFAIFFLCDNNVPAKIHLAVPPDVNDTWQISVR